jgi:hypothetical protein
MNPPSDSAFAPLASSPSQAAGRSDFQVTLVSREAATHSFHPVGHAPLSTAPGAGLEPRVTLQRDGDRISLIRIQCTCGHVIELSCAYETQAATASSSQPNAAMAEAMSADVAARTLGSAPGAQQGLAAVASDNPGMKKSVKPRGA